MALGAVQKLLSYKGEELVLMIEECNGLDALEELCAHTDQLIVEKATGLLHRHFDWDN